MSKEVTSKDKEQIKKEAKPEKVARTKGNKSDGPKYPVYRVEPGSKFTVADIDPDESEDYDEESALTELAEQRERLHEWQEKLYAEEERSLLVVLQAMDSGGKDGVGRGVFRGINPQGCHIWAFKVASDEEKKHDFLWRYHQKIPERGMIGVFNRSYYESVLASRVKGEIEKETWLDRYELINDFERLLTHDGVRIVKFFIHISKDEQKRRLEERLAEPTKHWLFSMSDIEERERWDKHMKAFEEAINKTSTEHAPWYALPSNKKWYRNLVIARTLVDTLAAMDPQYPPLEDEAKGVKVPD